MEMVETKPTEKDLSFSLGDNSDSKLVWLKANCHNKQRKIYTKMMELEKWIENELKAYSHMPKRETNKKHNTRNFVQCINQHTTLLAGTMYLYCK